MNDLTMLLTSIGALSATVVYLFKLHLSQQKSYLLTVEKANENVISLTGRINKLEGKEEGRTTIEQLTTLTLQQVDESISKCKSKRAP